MDIIRGLFATSRALTFCVHWFPLLYHERAACVRLPETARSKADRSANPPPCRTAFTGFGRTTRSGSNRRPLFRFRLKGAAPPPAATRNKRIQIGQNTRLLRNPSRARRQIQSRPGTPWPTAAIGGHSGTSGDVSGCHPPSVRVAEEPFSTIARTLIEDNPENSP